MPVVSDKEMLQKGAPFQGRQFVASQSRFGARSCSGALETESPRHAFRPSEDLPCTLWAFCARG